MYSTVIEDSKKMVGELERIAKQAMDLLECRIEAVLNEMGCTALCDLPEDEPITVDEFLSLTEQTCNEASELLAK